MQDMTLLVLLLIPLCLLSLLRPFIKRFRRIDGLTLVPGLAFILCVSIFPAYGFRPESVPLFLLCLFLFLKSIPRIHALWKRRRIDDFGKQGLLYTFSIGFLLAFAVYISLNYAPRLGGSKSDSPYSEFAAKDAVSGREYYLRVYSSLLKSAEAAPLRPLIILCPPVSGSIGMVDGLSGALRDRGFTVAVFSRKGLDFPSLSMGGRTIYPEFAASLRLALVSIFGMRFDFAQKMGARLEEERMGDILFIKEELKRGIQSGGPAFSGCDPDRVVLLGYGAGAAAITGMAADGKNTDLLAAIAVEGPLYSSLKIAAGSMDQSEIGILPEHPKIWDYLGYAWDRALGWGAAVKPKLVEGIGQVPAPRIPVLFIASDRIRKPESRDARYATLVRAFRAASSPAAIVSITGAGMFDYSDAPLEYPLYSALRPGAHPDRAEDAMLRSDTASIISNFIHRVIQWKAAAVEAAVGTRVNAATQTLYSLQSDAVLELSGPWNSTDGQGILGP